MRTCAIPNGLLVFDGERCLTGIGHHWYRPWLHPLHTPAGHGVLEAFPFDHPFHNGCFVAQHPVRCAGLEANFWAVPPPRTPDDEVFVNVGRVEVVSLSYPLTKSIWQAPGGEALLDEERRISLEVRGAATVCSVASTKIAAYGDVEFPATKFGGIGVRVHPLLLSAAGARIHGAHDAPAPFVAYDNGRFGLALVADGSLPWFVRDYGFAAWNPTWKQPLLLRKGERWTVALTLVAYDGERPSWIGSSR